MPVILCPTRGGQESYINQDKAIEIARERGASIVFLYVLNVQFALNFRSPNMNRLIQDEIEDVGEMMLTIAQERAEMQGLKASILLERGTFNEVLTRVIKEKEISILCLGSSEEDVGHTTKDYIHRLAQHIHEVTGVEIIITKHGEITDRL